MSIIITINKIWKFNLLAPSLPSSLETKTIIITTTIKFNLILFATRGDAARTLFIKFCVAREKEKKTKINYKLAQYKQGVIRLFFFLLLCGTRMMRRPEFCGCIRANFNYSKSASYSHFGEKGGFLMALLEFKWLVEKHNFWMRMNGEKRV